MFVSFECRLRVCGEVIEFVLAVRYRCIIGDTKSYWWQK